MQSVGCFTLLNAFTRWHANGCPAVNFAFSSGDTKLDRFLSRSQRTSRPLARSLFAFPPFCEIRTGHHGGIRCLLCTWWHECWVYPYFAGKSPFATLRPTLRPIAHLVPLLEFNQVCLRRSWKTSRKAVRLEPGRITVTFDQAQQALEKLLALAMAIGNDFDQFERQVRATRALREEVRILVKSSHSF